MNQVWSDLNPLLDGKLLSQASVVIAQLQNGRANGGAEQDAVLNLRQGFSDSLVNLLLAIIILIVGWIVAAIAKAIVRGILNRTNIDNRIASWISDRPEQESPKVEDWIAGTVFWIIIALTVVGVLQTLELDAVTQPFNEFLNGAIGFLDNLLGAFILILLAWLIATLVKALLTRSLRAIDIDQRLNQELVDTDAPPAEEPTVPPAERFSLSDTIGTAAYWFIFLLFLPLILQTLGLEATLEPVYALLNKILAILPNILAALVIAAVGWFIAQVVRRIVTNLLRAVNTDGFGEQFGFRRQPRNQSLSWLLGTLVYVLILIPVAIAALNALQIQAISLPAIAMLNQVLSILPNIFAAALILALAYVAAKFIGDLVTNILTSVGFNRVFNWLGLPVRPTAAPPPSAIDPGAVPPSPTVPHRTPSQLVGIIVIVGIMLFATLAAVNILNIPALTALVAGIILISGQVLVGLVVLAIGLYLANLSFNLILSSGSRNARFLAQSARIGIIAVAIPMALDQMGVASNIVNLAFGLLFGAVAVAIALAFGLGSRDVAGEQVRDWLNSFKNRE
ncbi:MAG: mechanosensitive ion channel [Chloroflexaceae bacterium]|nr:mechanosensitive ion channel [Chloroflexaceae bacterium]